MNHSHKGYTSAVDMWSLGCVVFTLLTGVPPFAIDAQSHGPKVDNVHPHLDGIVNDDSGVIPWNSVGSRAKDFVRKLLTLKESDRMTAPEALNHHWFTNSYLKEDFEAVYRKATNGWQRHYDAQRIIEALPFGRSALSTIHGLETEVMVYSVKRRPC